MKSRISTNTFCCGLVMTFVLLPCLSHAAYQEEYRPGFHFTAKDNTAILQRLLPLAKTKKFAQAATALMGLVYFIDDYSMFFDSLAFRFYSILMLGFVFCHILIRPGQNMFRANCHNMALKVMTFGGIIEDP